jgi:hypothetical protein
MRKEEKSDYLHPTPEKMQAIGSVVADSLLDFKTDSKSRQYLQQDEQIGRFLDALHG